MALDAGWPRRKDTAGAPLNANVAAVEEPSFREIHARKSLICNMAKIRKQSFHTVVRLHNYWEANMTTNSTAESLQGEMALRELSRRASLLELARGRKMFSLYEAVYLFLAAMLFFFVFLDRAHIPLGVFYLFGIVVFLNLMHTTRIQKRLIAIIDLLELQKNEQDFRN